MHSAELKQELQQETDQLVTLERVVCLQFNASMGYTVKTVWLISRKEKGKFQQIPW